MCRDAEKYQNISVIFEQNKLEEQYYISSFWVGGNRNYYCM